MKPHRIAIFASGSGTNAEEILAYFQYHPSIEVKVLLSNNPRAQALQRAERFKVKALTFNKAQFRDTYEVLAWLKDEKVTHIVLAGFMWLVPDYLIHAYPGKIINIHPALLPKFGGKGMYGKFVHEAVKAAGEVETGITIHEVNEHYDEGNIVFQATCGIEAADSVETIVQKVQKLEHIHYPKVIEQWILQR